MFVTLITPLFSPPPSLRPHIFAPLLPPPPSARITCVCAYFPTRHISVTSHNSSYHAQIRSIHSMEKVTNKKVWFFFFVFLLLLLCAEFHSISNGLLVAFVLVGRARARICVCCVCISKSIENISVPQIHFAYVVRSFR